MMQQFKEFDKNVQSYTKLGNHRYLVTFKDGNIAFYEKVGNKLRKEKEYDLRKV